MNEHTIPYKQNQILSTLHWVFVSARVYVNRGCCCVCVFFFILVQTLSPLSCRYKQLKQTEKSGSVNLLMTIGNIM